MRRWEDRRVARHAALAGWKRKVTAADRGAHAWPRENFGAEIEPILTPYDRSLPLESGLLDVVTAYRFFCFDHEDGVFWLLAIRFLDEAALACTPTRDSGPRSRRS